MIPSIEDIVAGLLAGTIAQEQAVAWLNRHVELAELDITTRDYFAAGAMQAACSHPASGQIEDWLAINAKFSYLAADAMLKARAE